MTNSYRPGLIWLVDSQPVNPVQPKESHTKLGLAWGMFVDAVYQENITNQLKQCQSWKALQTATECNPKNLSQDQKCQRMRKKFDVDEEIWLLKDNRMGE